MSPAWRKAGYEPAQWPCPRDAVRRADFASVTDLPAGTADTSAVVAKVNEVLGAARGGSNTEE